MKTRIVASLVLMVLCGGNVLGAAAEEMEEDTGKIWLAIDRWDTEFLYITGLSTGLGSNDIGLDRGLLGGTRIVRFERVGPKVLLVQPNYGFRAESDDADYVGDTTLTVEELRDFLLELSEEQFDIHIHTMGDLAVRRVLDAVEAAKAIARDDFYPRVTIAHLGLIDAADLPRIKQLGVIANYTPWWFTADQDDPLKVWLGDDRYASMYSPKALFDLGIEVTFSSDEWWGGDRLPTYLNPYFGMQIGHTRQAPKEWREEDDDAVRPPADAALSIEQLIAGYTQNGAYQLRMEDQIGSIETGKLADLIILNDNLFDMESDQIWKVKPAAVLMEGEVIQGALPL